VDPLFAAALWSDDVSEKRSHARQDHKTLQLCAQVRDAVSLALSGECHDDLLREVYVDGVEPAPNASRLLVRLIVPARATIDVRELYERLAIVSPYLRSIVAKEISRKRTPELSFIAIPESEVQP
jgi:ribosome-binding factor A